ncbi:hypothetical protein CASFOL_032258 [Castilleja foliolosa]|uniref:Uncharacterized protein n=1 Tax=Castilleja foliolosa TaxID=1961234 RepID=A0ABD3C1J5_9LAMI
MIAILQIVASALVLLKLLFPISRTPYTTSFRIFFRQDV